MSVVLDQSSETGQLQNIYNYVMLRLMLQCKWVTSTR